MEIDRWTKIIVHWINCLSIPNLNVTCIRDLLDINIFYNLINYLDNLNSENCNLDKDTLRDSVLNFLKREYPHFANNNTENYGEEDAVVIASLLLHYSCVKTKDGSVRGAMCQRLGQVEQKAIMYFANSLMKLENITENNLKDVIMDLPIYEGILESPLLQSPLLRSPLLRSPLLRSPLFGTPGASPGTPSGRKGRRSRKMMRLEAALETERFDRNYLQEELKRINVKVQDLEKQHVIHLNEISQLRSELSTATLSGNGYLDGESGETPRKKIELHLREEVYSLEKELLQMEGDMSALHSEREITHKKMGDLEKNLAEWQVQAMESESARESLNTQVEDIKSQNSSLKLSLAEAYKLIDEYRLEHQKNLSIECDDDNVTLKKSFGSSFFSSSVENLGKAVIDVQLKEQIYQNNILNSQVEELQKGKVLLDANIKKLEKELSEYKVDYQELSTENTELQNKVQTLLVSESQLELCETQLLEKQKDYDILLEDKNNIKEMLINEKSEVINLHQELITKEEQIDALSNLKDDMQKRILDLDSTVENCKQDILSKNQKIENLSNDIKMVENNIDLLKNKYDDFVQESQQTINTLTEEGKCREKKMEQKLAQTSHQLQECEKQSLERNEKIENFINNKSVLEEKVNKLEDDIIKMSNTLAEKIHDAEMLTDIKCSLEEQIINLQNTIKNNQQENEMNLTSIKGLNSTVKIIECENDTLKNNLKDLQEESGRKIKDLIHDAEILTDTKCSLEEQIINLQNTIKNNQQENEINLTSIKGLNSTVKIIECENDTLKNNLKDLQEESERKIKDLMHDAEILTDTKCSLEEQIINLQNTIKNNQQENEINLTSIKGLNSTVKIIECENDTLKNNLKDLQEESERKIKDLIEEKNNTEKELVQAVLLSKNQLKLCESQLLEKQKEYEILLEDKNSEVKNVHQELITKEEQIDALSNLKDDMQKQISDLDSTIENCKQDILSKNQKIENLSNDIKMMENNIDSLENKYDDFVQESQQTINTLTEEGKCRENKLVQTLQVYKSQLELFETQLLEKQKEYDILLEDKNNIKDMLTKEESKVINLHQELTIKDEQISTLSNLKDDMQKHISDLDGTIENCKQDIHSKNQNIDKLSDNMKVMENNIDLLNKKYDDFVQESQQTINTLNEEGKCRENELEQKILVNCVQLKKCEEQLAEGNKKLEILTNNKNESKKKVHKLEDDVIKVNNTLAEKIHDLDLMTSTKCALEEQIENLRSKIKDNKQENERNLANIKDLDSLVKIIRCEKETLQNNLKHLQQASEVKIKGLNEEKINTEKEVIQRFEIIQNQLEESAKKNVEKNEQINTLSQEKSNLLRFLDIEKTNVNDIQLEIYQNVMEIKSLHVTQDNMLSQCGSLKTSIEDYKQNIQNYIEQIQEITNKLQKAENENNMLTEKYENLKKESQNVILKLTNEKIEKKTEMEQLTLLHKDYIENAEKQSSKKSEEFHSLSESNKDIQQLLERERDQIKKLSVEISNKYEELETSNNLNKSLQSKCTELQIKLDTSSQDNIESVKKITKILDMAFNEKKISLEEKNGEHKTSIFSNITSEKVKLEVKLEELIKNHIEETENKLIKKNEELFTLVNSYNNVQILLEQEKSLVKNLSTEIVNKTEECVLLHVANKNLEIEQSSLKTSLQNYVEEIKIHKEHILELSNNVKVAEEKYIAHEITTQNVITQITEDAIEKEKKMENSLQTSKTLLESLEHQVLEHVHCIETLTQNNKSIKEKLNEEEKLVTNLKNEILQKTEQITLLIHAQETLQKEVIELNDSVKVHEQEINGHIEHIQELSSTIELVKNENIELHTKFADTNITTQKIKQSLNEKVNTEKELTKNINHYKKEIDIYKHNESVYHKMLHCKTQQLSDNLHDIVKMNSYAEKLDVYDKMLRQTWKTLCDAIANLKNTGFSIINDFISPSVLKQLEIFMNQIDITISEYSEQLTFEHVNNYIQNICQIVSSLVQQSTHSKSTLTSLQNERETLSKDFQNYKDKYECASNEIDCLNKKLIELEMAKEKLEKSLDSSDAISSTTGKNCIVEISNTFGEFVNKVYENKSKIEDIFVIHEEQTKNINAARKSLNKLNSQIFDYLGDTNALNIVLENKKRCEDNLSNLEKQNSDLSKNIFQLLSNICINISSDLVTFKEQNKEGEKDYIHSQNDISAIDLLKEVNNLEAESKIMQYNVSDLQSSINKIESTKPSIALNEIHGFLNLKNNDVSVYFQLQDFIKKYTTVKEEVTRLKDIRYASAETVKQLRSKNIEIIRKNNELTNKMSALRKVLKEMETKNNELSLTNEQLKSFKDLHLESSENEHRKIISENTNLKKQIDTLSKEVDSVSLKLNSEMDMMKNSYDTLLIEHQKVQSKLANGGDSNQLVTDMRNEYEDKLTRMKQKMKQLYQDQIAVFTEKQKEETAGLEALCKKYMEKIKKYEMHVNQLMFEQWKVGEKLLNEKKENEELRKKLKENLGSQQSLNSITSTISLPHTQKEIQRNSLNVRSVSRYNEMNRRGLPSPIKERRSTFKQPLPNKAESGGLHMSDEEGEVFDNTYLTEMKAGVCESRANITTNSQLYNDRLSELQRRNSLYPPHLKSSYPAEIQFHKVREEEVKMGTINLIEDSPVVERPRNKKEAGQTSYHKPGPPTPSKNSGRPSLGNDLREPLKEQNDIHPKKGTPSRIKALFMGNNSKSSRDENTFGTPKSRRLSIFRK